MPDHSGDLDLSAHALVMANDFGHVIGQMARDDRDAFRFVATRDKVSINAISGNQQRGVQVRVFDQEMAELTDAQSDAQRQPFQGEVITVQPGHEYYVVVEEMPGGHSPSPDALTLLGSDASPSDQYSLAVYQFDSGQWPLGEQVSSDPEADLVADATLLDVSAETHKSVRAIDYAGDVDMFRFRTQIEGPSYALIAVGGFGEYIDVDFAVLDATGQPMDTTSTSWVSEVEWVVAVDVEPEQNYFLRVQASADSSGQLSSATGEYSLTLKLGQGIANGLPMVSQPFSNSSDAPLGSDVHASTFEEATSLVLGESLIDFVDIDSRAAQRSSGVDYFGDEDLFKIPAAGDVMLVAVEGDNVSLEVYDEQRQVVSLDSRIFKWDLPIGGSYDVTGSDHFFVRVFGDGESISGYFLEAQALGADVVHGPKEPVHSPFGSDDPISDPTGPGETINSEDLHGDTFSNATDVAVHGEYVSLAGTLQTIDDVDVFRIPNVLPGTLGVLGLDGITLEVFDQQGNLIPARYGGDTPGLNFGYRDAVGGDFVFLRVASQASSTGRYNLSFLHTGTVPEVLPGFDPQFDAAASFSLPDSALGDDPHPGVLQGSRRFIIDETSDVLVSSFIDSPGDVDVFRSRRSAGDHQSYVYTLDSNLEDPSVRVFDRLGNELRPDSIVERPGSLELTFDKMVIARNPGRTYGDISIWISAGESEFGQYTLRGNRVFEQPTNWEWAPDPTDDVRTALLPPHGGFAAGFGGSTLGVDGHGEAAELATPINLALPELQVGSYIDEPGDKDAFRFTAEYSNAIFVLYDQFGSSRDGSVTILDSDGNEVGEVVRREGAEEKGIRASLEIGEDYVAVVEAASDAVGGYHLKIQPLGDVASLLDAACEAVIAASVDRASL